MKSTIALLPNCDLRDAATSPQLILVHITNLYDLVSAYGTTVDHDITIFIKTRLEALGSPEPAVFLGSPYVFIDLDACHNVHFYSQDVFCEHVNALLTFEPIMCAKEHAFLRVETTFIDRNDKESRLINDCQSASVKDKILAASARQEGGQKKKSYRADMALALRLFSQLTANTLVLAFQPIISIKDTSIYWKSTPRQCKNSGSSEFSTCITHIAALERLGLVSRLDRSVLWTILDLLIKEPGIKLGCNISVQSLKFDCWWRLIFDALQTRPAAASRLTIEITETSATTQDDEALTLLQTLSVLGCKMAIDDMGSEYSALDLPDRAGLDLSPCVITEGIESEQDRADAIAAGAQRFQSYLFGRLDVLPSWLNYPVAIRDAFEPEHPSHSLLR